APNTQALDRVLRSHDEMRYDQRQRNAPVFGHSPGFILAKEIRLVLGYRRTVQCCVCVSIDLRFGSDPLVVYAQSSVTHSKMVLIDGRLLRCRAFGSLGFCAATGVDEHENPFAAGLADARSGPPSIQIGAVI